MSMPVSSSATVIPLPSKPGMPASSGRRPAPRANAWPLQLARRERGRIGRPDGIHAGHVGVTLEQRQRSAVDGGGEPVERTGVDEVGDELDPLARQPRGDLLLPGERGGRPAAHRPTRWPGRPPRPCDRRVEGFLRTTIIRWPTATALRSPSTKPRQAAAPPSTAPGGCGTLAASGREQRHGHDEPGGEPATVRCAMHMRRGQGNEDREGSCRTCPRTRSSRRCRCTERAVRSGRREAPRAAPSWPQPRRRRRSSPVRSCSAARPVCSASACTIACWYDAARSALRDLGLAAELAHLVQKRGLQTGEGEVEARPGGRPETRTPPGPPSCASRSISAPPG